LIDLISVIGVHLRLNLFHNIYEIWYKFFKLLFSATMKNWAIFFFTFVLSIFLSVIFIKKAEANLCFKLDWLGSNCKGDENGFWVIFGFLFPFVFFPLSAIVLKFSTAPQTKSEIIFLFFFGAFPFLFAAASLFF